MADSLIFQPWWRGDHVSIPRIGEYREALVKDQVVFVEILKSTLAFDGISFNVVNLATGQTHELHDKLIGNTVSEMEIIALITQSEEL